jgi:SAM-dependent methyltransferase
MGLFDVVAYALAMERVDGAILRHYETIREEERISEGFGQLELLRAQEVLRRHLPKPPALVLDVGGATGVHASWLAHDGYQVRLVDISPRHIAKANNDLGPLGVVAELGDARELAASNDTYDVVLLFGPLYHLPDREDRLTALREAARVVRPGGVVAVAAVNRFASMFDGLAREFLFDPDFAAMARQDLADGQHRNPEERPHWWTTAYFHRPDELRSEVIEAGLYVREVVGLEGLAGYLPHLAARWDDETDRNTILWSARAVENEPALIGLSAHLLVLAAPTARP